MNLYLPIYTAKGLTLPVLRGVHNELMHRSMQRYGGAKVRVSSRTQFACIISQKSIGAQIQRWTIYSLLSSNQNKGSFNCNGNAFALLCRSPCLKYTLEARQACINSMWQHRSCTWQAGLQSTGQLVVYGPLPSKVYKSECGCYRCSTAICPYLLEKMESLQVILQDVCLNLRPGDCLGLLGQNGSGKSTLMQILTGQSLPSSGQVLMQGASIELSLISSFEPGISFCPQEDPLSAHLTAREHLHLIGAFRVSQTGFLERVALTVQGCEMRDRVCISTTLQIA